jgi:integrase
VRRRNRRAVANSGLIGPLHGFRATLSTWAREQTDYPAEVIEAAINHKQPDKVVAAYARTTYFDRRRDLFQDWADYAFGNG